MDQEYDDAYLEHYEKYQNECDALDLIQDCLENHYLNLRELNEKEAEEFESALEFFHLIVKRFNLEG